jgi:hypothetical protein
MPYIKVSPVYDPKMIALCVRPYPNHPKGCPNFGKKKNCPPCPPIHQVIDLNQNIYAIYNVFNFGEHVRKMQQKHPNWTRRQLECCLYWQPKARKQLKIILNEFLHEHKDYFVVVCPEACGVNLTDTMALVGINLEWPPKSKTYQIILAGIRKG